MLIGAFEMVPNVNWGMEMVPNVVAGFSPRYPKTILRFVNKECQSFEFINWHVS